MIEHIPMIDIVPLTLDEEAQRVVVDYLE